jgi:hypothetical protein
MLAMKETRGFSRDLRPTLGRRIQDDAVLLVLDVYKASSSKEKVGDLERLLERLQALELSFHLAFDLRLINTEALADALDIIGGIGRQAGGWLKKAKRNTMGARHAATQAI